MAQTQSTEQERTANLRDVQGARASKTTRLNITPRGEHQGEAEIVKREIIRVLGNDRRLGLVGDQGADFLLSMGMTVKDAADRARLLALSLPFAIVYRP